MRLGLPVNAPQVLLIRGFAVDVVFDNHGHILMAYGAGEGNIVSVGRGFGVGDLFDVVLPVAIPALGDFLVPSLEVGPSVDAVGIRKGALSRTERFALAMANPSAIDVGQGFGVGQLCPFGPSRDHMTICAPQVPVDGRLEGLFIDLEVSVRPTLRPIAVTNQAIRIPGGWGSRCLGKKARPEREKDKTEKNRCGELSVFFQGLEKSGRLISRARCA